MSDRRADRLRREGRAFRPSLDGQMRLETKILLSTQHFHQPIGIPGQVRTAAGGSAVEVVTPQGQTFYVAVSSGKIRARSVPGGRFTFNVISSSIDSTLTISPLIDYLGYHSAHNYNARAANYTNILNVAGITVQSGTIGQIVGYRDAVLSGPIVSLGTTRIDRIAFEQILPGASIFTGGDVNTLDVLNNINLSGAGTGIVIGRDLNALTVGGNLSVTNNAVFSIGRFAGLTPQLNHGTGPLLQGQSAIVTGNLILNGGGQFLIGQQLVQPFVIDGSIIGSSNFHIKGGAILTPLATQPNLVVGGTITP
jgi:hypothetical protein